MARSTYTRFDCDSMHNLPLDGSRCSVVVVTDRERIHKLYNSVSFASSDRPSRGSSTRTHEMDVLVRSSQAKRLFTLWFEPG